MAQSWGQSSARRLFPQKAAGWAGLLFLATACSLHADLPFPVTLDLPVPANQATPAWLGHPETPNLPFATLSLPILTPDPNASLLVTVNFDERQGGFLRIIWKGTQGEELLSDNFYENIGMTNQRSLLISPGTLLGDGTLIFQCGDATLGIKRIKLEWLEAKTGLVSPEVHDVTVTASNGQTQMSQDVNGQPAAANAAMWQNQVVSVPLTDVPVRIEQGVDFSVDLDKAPTTARLSLKEAGLPLGQHIVVWVNDQRAGIISPGVPDLLDTGFVSDDKNAPAYAGWRDGSFYVPPSLLKAGVNYVEFTDENDTPGTGASITGTALPLAVKSMVLEMNYQAPGPKNGLTQAQFWQTPSEPINPATATNPAETTP